MRLAAIISCISLALIMPSAYSLNKEQKDELYRHGTITVYDDSGEKTGHFEVNFMPGAENVKKDSERHMQKAYDRLSDLVDKEMFWEYKVLGRFKDGVRFVHRNTVEKGVMAIPRDFVETRAENKKIAGDFGARAGQIRNWLKFSGRTGARLMRTVLSIAGGGVYMFAAPVLTVASRPLVAGAEAVFAGLLWPSVKFVWNGAAWVMAKDNNEPKKESMTVRFVPLARADDDEEVSA